MKLLILALLTLVLISACLQPAQIDSQEDRILMKEKCLAEAREISTVHLFEGGCDFTEEMDCLCRTENGAILIYEEVIREVLR